MNPAISENSIYGSKLTQTTRVKQKKRLEEIDAKYNEHQVGKYLDEMKHTIYEKDTLPSSTKKDPYAEVWGIWDDRDIDAKTLRKQAWGI